MSHQCTKCSALYPDIVMACACGGKAFLFIREGEAVPEGTYDLDIAALLSRQALSGSDGKYSINLQEGFRRK